MRGRGILVLAALVLSGCDVELDHPLFDEREELSEPLLEGVWQCGPNRYAFAHEGKGVYRLSYITEGKCPGRGDNSDKWRLVRLGDHYFLNPAAERTFEPLRISFVGGNLRVAPLNNGWLKGYLARHPRALPHEIMKDRYSDSVRLKAETKELQRFFLDHMDDLFGVSLRAERIDKTPAPLLPDKGPASKVQRTRDCWFLLRTALLYPTIHPVHNGRQCVGEATRAARDLEEMADGLVDREAADTARRVARVFKEIARAVPESDDFPEPLVRGVRDLLRKPSLDLNKERRPLAPVQKALREALEAADKARAVLAKRYGRGFPPLTDDAPEK